MAGLPEFTFNLQYLRHLRGTSGKVAQAVLILEIAVVNAYR